MEAAHPDVNGVDLAAAEHADQFVACFLKRKPVANDVAMFARHLDGVRKSKKTRRMQHHDVKRVAFYPFSTIDEASQRPELIADRNVKGILDRMHCAHLIGDRADSANASDDIRHFRVAPPAKQSLKKAGGFEYIQRRRSDPSIANFQVRAPSPSTRAR